MDFSPIISGLIGAVITFFLLGALLGSGKKRPIFDHAGRTVLTNTLGMKILGVCFIPFIPIFLFMAFGAFAKPEEGVNWLLLIVGLPLAILMLFGVYSTFIVAAKFDEHGIFYRHFWRWRYIPWNHIQEVVDHSGLGTYMKSDYGRLWVSKYRRGFSELLAKLCKNNIKGAKELKEEDF